MKYQLTKQDIVNREERRKVRNKRKKVMQKVKRYKLSKNFSNPRECGKGDGSH